MDRQAVSVRVPQLVRLRSTKDLIDRVPGEPLSIAVLAAHAGYSRYHFIRAFDAAFGETPSRYRLRRRMERARDLLAFANVTVREVAELVGFTSLAAFSTRFKAQVGVTPTAYRSEMVRRGGSPPVPGYVVMWSRRHPSGSTTAISRKHTAQALSTIAVPAVVDTSERLA